MKYLWLNKDETKMHFCSQADRRCMGASCVAWLPSERDEKYGRCLHVPAIDDEE